MAAWGNDGNPLAQIESAYLAARDARDRLDVARVRGDRGDRDALEVEATGAGLALAAALEAMSPGDEAALGDDDRQALAAIRAGAATALAVDAGLPVAPSRDRGECFDEGAVAHAIEAGGETLRHWLEACYGAVADSLVVDGATITRPAVLTRPRDTGHRPGTRRVRAGDHGPR